MYLYFITGEMLNTETCRGDKVLIFLRNPFRHGWKDLRYSTVSTCNCEHPARDPFSVGQIFIYVGKLNSIKLNYLDSSLGSDILQFPWRSSGFKFKYTPSLSA